MALGEWLRQVMVGTSALRQRAGDVAMLVASRELVALRLESKTHSALVIERNWLRNDFLFLGGRAPRVKELFRGNAVELLLQRGRLRAEAERVQVVAAPWKFFDSAPQAFKWHRFLSAQLAIAPGLAAQLALVRSPTQRRDLAAAAQDEALKFPVSRSKADFDRFYSQLYAPFTRQRLGAHAVLEPKEDLARDFADGGTVVFVTRKGRLMAGALLLNPRRNGLVFHRSGFARAGGLSPRQLAARVAALDLAVFRHAQEEKFAWIDFGETSSVLTDPQFVDRRHLGCTFVATPSSPALMLEVAPRLRPTLFATTPLLTGEPGALVAQLGFPRAGTKSAGRLAKVAAEFSGAGIDRISISTDAPRDLPARVRHENALRKAAAGIELEVDEIKPPRPSAR